MIARIPSPYIPLGEAVIQAACVWFSDEIRQDGFTKDEVAKLIRWRLASAKVAEGTRRSVRGEPSRKGIPVVLTPEDKEAAAETPEIKALRERVKKIQNIPRDAYDRLRDRLATGQLVGYIISDNGKAFRVEPHLWSSEDAHTAHERGLLRFASRYGEWITGSAAVPRIELAAILAGKSTEVSGRADQMSKRGGGRKSNPDADRFWIEVCRLIKDAEIEGGRTGCIEKMSQWASDNMAEPYEEDTVRKKISNLSKHLGWD